MATEFINPTDLWIRKASAFSSVDQDLALQILEEIHKKPLTMKRQGGVGAPLFFRKNSGSSAHRVSTTPVRYLIQTGLEGVTIDNQVIPIEKPIEYQAPGVLKDDKMESSVGRHLQLTTQERQHIELLRILPPHISKEILSNASHEAREFIKEINKLL